MNADAKKRYKDIDFPFTCPVTGRVFESAQGLSCYVTKTLKSNHEEYYLKWVNHRDSNCFFCNSKGHFISISKGFRNLCNSEECKKKSFSSNTVEGFMYRFNCSRADAEILFEKENVRQLEQRVKSHQKLRDADPLWDKRRSRNCQEFWISKGLSVEDAKIEVDKVMKEIHEKTSHKLKSNPDKYANKYPTKVEYYLKRGFTETEAKEKISIIQNRFSLKGCIEKFGESVGTLVWKKRQEKWKHTLDSKTDSEKIEINKKKLMNNSGYSKISQDLFWRVYDNFQSNDIHFEELNSEIIRYDKENKKHYKYDYVDFTTKKCIEFNGDYWHCNPMKYNEEFTHPIIKIKAKEIWEKDSLKNEWITQRGYKVLTIWESEYKKNPQQILEKCIKFIHE
jgi:hypothetical protein